jgi:hypothetical protein
MKKYAIAFMTILQALSLFGSDELNVRIERKRCRSARAFSFDDYALAQREWRKHRDEWKKDQVVTHDKPWARDGVDDFITKLITHMSPEVKKTDQ